MASAIHDQTTRPSVDAAGAPSGAHRPEVIIMGPGGVVVTPPVAAALADAAAANPTTVTYGNIPLVMNATTVDRQRAVVNGLDSVGTGIIAAGIVGQYDDVAVGAVTENQFAPVRIDSTRQLMVNTELPAAAALADGAANPSTPLIGACQSQFNGTTWDRERGNVESTLIASAARTATFSTADQVNYNGRGVMVILEVTANPGGAETLRIDIESRGTGSTRKLATSAANAFGGGTGYLIFIMYPGAVETVADANLEVQGIPLLRDWRLTITHSAAGSWTYSARVAVLL